MQKKPADLIVGAIIERQRAGAVSQSASIATEID